MPEFLTNARAGLFEWLTNRHYGLGNKTSLPIADEVRPVVMIDDVSHLKSPEPVLYWMAHEATGAVVARNSGVAVSPDARTVVITDVHVSFDSYMFCFKGTLSIDNIVAISPNSWGTDNYGLGMIFQGGDFPSDAGSGNVDGKFYVEGNVAEAVSVVLRPGEHMVLMGVNSNTAMTATVQGIELPNAI